MNIAIRKALKVLDTYGLSSSFVTFQHISTILDNEGILLNTFPFKGRLRERYICTEDGIAQITIKDCIDTPEAKHLIAHALGHHFMHKGSYAFIDNIVLDKQERQAEDFAAVLLAPPKSISSAKPKSTYQLAVDYEIPELVAETRMNIYKVHNL